MFNYSDMHSDLMELSGKLLWTVSFGYSSIVFLFRCSRDYNILFTNPA